MALLFQIPEMVCLVIMTEKVTSASSVLNMRVHGGGYKGVLHPHG